MDTRKIPVITRTLAFAKTQGCEQILALGKDAQSLAHAIEAVNKNRLVIAVPSEGCKAPALDTLPKSIPRPTLQSSTTGATTIKWVDLDFQLLICTGSPRLTAIPAVRRTLRSLSLLSSPSSRIMIEMYRISSNAHELEHWSQTERRYRRAVQTAGFQLQEVNGVTRDDDFPTTIVDVHAFTVSLIDAANLTETADASGSDKLRRVARTQRKFLKRASSRNVKDAVDRWLERLLGGGTRRLFATLRAS